MSNLVESSPAWGETSSDACVSSAPRTCAEVGQLSLGPGDTVSAAAWMVARSKLAFTSAIVTAVGHGSGKSVFAANGLTKLRGPEVRCRSMDRRMFSEAGISTRSTSLGLVAMLFCVDAIAAPKPLRPTGKVTSDDGILQDAFAFDETGSKLATIRFSAQGQVLLTVGPPGGNKLQLTEISAFTSTPEKILGIGGYWFVVSNEGQRRAAIIDPAGHLKRTTQRFDDCELSFSPKAFVAVSEQQELGGNRRFSIQAYRPDGTTLVLQEVVVESGGTIVGGEGETFLGFTDSHLSVMVEKPGAYDRKTDMRLPPQFAIRDVKTGKTGPGKTRPNLEDFLDYVRKRGEKPDLSAVIVPAAGKTGFEIVGPGEKVRSLNLTVTLAPGFAVPHTGNWRSRWRTAWSPNNACIVGLFITEA